MDQFSSPFNVPLPPQMQLRQPADLSSELDKLLLALKSIHFSLIEAYGFDSLSFAQVQGSQILAFNDMAQKTLLVAEAESAVVANRAVGLRVVDGVYFAGHAEPYISGLYVGAVGLAQNNAAVGEKFFIYTRYAVVGGFSALTPGAGLYVTEDGELTEDRASIAALPGGVRVQLLASAVSPTELRILAGGPEFL